MISFTLNLISQFENHKNDTKYSDDDDFIDSILNQKINLLSWKDEVFDLINKEHLGENDNMKDLEQFWKKAGWEKSWGRRKKRVGKKKTTGDSSIGSDNITPIFNELSMKSIEDYFNQMEWEEKESGSKESEEILTQNF